jgi:hypothetical protein
LILLVNRQCRRAFFQFYRAEEVLNITEFTDLDSAPPLTYSFVSTYLRKHGLDAKEPQHISNNSLVVHNLVSFRNFLATSLNRALSLVKISSGANLRCEVLPTEIIIKREHLGIMKI